jgi:DNA-binding CsgD family transcriptional regulator
VTSTVLIYDSTMLLGRESEQRAVDDLLEGARAGRSGVLIVRGEPGIGKTALLAYAAERAEEMKPLRSVGIEAEHELPFAGLHQLLRPCLGLLDRLPAPQAAALEGALGLSFDPVQNPFLVSLGVLGLLAEASEERPVVCLVDDAQWLDGPSTQALSFAVRRLEAEPVAVLIAARTGDHGALQTRGLHELELHGLDEGPARELLDSRSSTPVAPDVGRALLRAAGGNPLALIELPSGLSDRQLQGAEPIVEPPTVRGPVEERFRARLAELSDPVRRALLLAAADIDGALTTLQRAIERAGLPASALEEAERTGLVQLNGEVEFRHPLVRSAVYHSASRGERRAAHETLAAVLEDPVASAWHKALMSAGVDEAIAAELDQAGGQAYARGAPSTAAAAFERAAGLSETSEGRGHRLVLAAQTSLAAGRSDAALRLVEQARPLVAQSPLAVELDVVCGAVWFRKGSPAETFSVMRSAATALAETNPERALELVGLMVLASAQGGWVATGVTGALEVLELIEVEGAHREFIESLLRGAVAVVNDEAANAALRFAAALKWAERLARDPAVTTLAGLVGLWTADFQGARDRFARLVADYRAAGLITELAGALPMLVIGELCIGRIGPGFESAAEGRELARELSYENDEISYLALQSWMAALLGDEQECRQLAAEVSRRGLASGVGWTVNETHLALGLLELGLGDPRAALEHLEQLDPSPLPPTKLLATPELIDAALRTGQPERATEALEVFIRWAPVSRTPFVDGLVARCQALLASDPDEADELFTEALRHHDHRVTAFERARTQLAYGEWLRRDRRRVQARVELRAALDAFEGLGATLWAERARGELRATGETARKRDVSTLDALTPQELRVARLVAGGATNNEVAAQLFLSRRTVEYHLAKVFVKVGVASRAQLAQLEIEPALAGEL